mgnify:CR=1 FL=1
MARKKVREDGRFVKTFTLDGRKYFAYGRTQKEAGEAAEKKKKEIKEGLISRINTPNMTLDEYHGIWAGRRNGVVSPATIRNQDMWYKTVSVTETAGIAFGKFRLNQITTETVFDLQRTLREARKKDGSPRYNTNSINCYINLVKHILQDAVNEDILQKNPARLVKNLQRVEEKAADTIHRALTMEETSAFLDAARESSYLNHFKFMLLTGCRCGEGGALRYAVIDGRGGKLQIRRTITRGERGMYVVGDKTKPADGIRDIPLSDKILAVINDQRNIRAAFGSLRFDDLIFTAPEGGLLNDTCVNREIARICAAASVEKFTAHCFRDTFATRAIEAGMNPKTLQEILGHADISITMNLYCHVMEETKTKEMEMVMKAVPI